jgi:aspartyl-tRNA(Asn)/glutamyl-tRNA(Gln) amidotransferase subunit A
MELLNDDNLTIARVSRLLRRGRLSPVELVEFCLARAGRLQPELNAFITLAPERARREARRAEKEIRNGNYRGALHGIPVTLKDLIYTKGIRTTGGSRILSDFTPTEDAAVVERLREAGCVVLGKTNLHEFAFGVTNENPHYGPVRNPWDSSRVSGGSSGGSAASVVSALGLASLGTDTGGSVRIPAAACGCVGLKPTYGRVPLHGVIPLAYSLDHVGPLCRSVEDAALVLSAIAGADMRDPSGFGRSGENFSRGLRKGLRGVSIGVPKQYFFECLQPEVRSAVDAAIGVLESEGAELRHIEFRSMDETGDLGGTITVAEAVCGHWEWLQNRPQDYGADLRERMQENRDMPALRYLKARELQRSYTADFQRSLEQVTALAAPTIPVVAPRIGEGSVRIGRRPEDVRSALLRLTRPANLTGLPAISVPCGFSSEGLPIGLQIIGRRFDEAAVLRVAYAYEQATPWHRRFPQL